jgi:hypothetical protein
LWYLRSPGEFSSRFFYPQSATNDRSGDELLDYEYQ